MKVDGRCHCGRISYEATIDPAEVSICHCSDCQMLTGSAWRVSVFAAPDAFSLLSGEPRRYVKIADNGVRRIQAFCPDCGSPVYSSDLVHPSRYWLRVGCLSQRAELPPMQQIWCRSALPWSSNIEGVEAMDRQ